MDNKTVLEKANDAISKGDHETFLSHCSENTKWIFVGDQVLSGKEEVRNYLADAYRVPLKFDVEYMVSEGDFVTAVGVISLLDKEGQWTDYDYCDVWRFKDGKMAELRGFVIPR